MMKTVQQSSLTTSMTLMVPIICPPNRTCVTCECAGPSGVLESPGAMLLLLGSGAGLSSTRS